MDIRNNMPLMVMPVMLIVVEVLGILLALPMQAAGVAAFEDPTSVANPFIFLGLLLAFTLLMLGLIRIGGKKVILGLVALSIFLTFYYIFWTLSAIALGVSSAAFILPLAAAGAATAVLFLYPEWYVIDTLGILIAGGVASIFGISLAVLPVVLLLSLLAVYDALSVYRTKHMIALAEGIIDLKTPILFVIPKKRDFSFRKEGMNLQQEKEERGAFIMGMGDLIMPSILVVSAQVFVPTPALWFISVPALGAMAGSVVGMAVLLKFVLSGRPQAGLPPLNGGAILGFLLGCALSGSWGWLLIA
ncbi:presenilin family intramembrane aspartyl protease PSH [Methanofollis ethanolicus]|uniref:presenilin family intramembrane aspartyl protease PSH n=1 Tax=Methanofollis ethanolicus TaxID=488124 RepID=UPI000829B8F9|nr:presenilin family intramembrane aspartyl protease PSH [Methanofollis ethanolicus]